MYYALAFLIRTEMHELSQEHLGAPGFPISVGGPSLCSGRCRKLPCPPFSTSLLNSVGEVVLLRSLAIFLPECQVGHSGALGKSCKFITSSRKTLLFLVLSHQTNMQIISASGVREMPFQGGTEDLIILLN